MKNTLRQEPVKNTFIYYSALISSIFIGWLITKINTNYLEISAYGQYSFFITFIVLSRSFFSFGFFESSSRLLAVSTDKEDRAQLMGAGLSLALVFSLLASLVLFIAGSFVDHIFEVKIGQLCQIFFFGIGIYVLISNLSLILRGSGRIKSLSVMTVSSRLIYLILLLLIIQFGQLTLLNTLWASFIGLAVVIVLGWVSLKPSFKVMRIKINVLWEEVKSYGRHIYVSTIWADLLIHVDKFLISYFLDEQAMAFYGLAFAISFPLSHFSTSMATSLFNRFATDEKISRKVLLSNLLFVSVSVTVFILLREPIVLYFFSANYAPTIELLPLLALAFGFSGLSKPYTLFLMARKQGKVVRNISIVIPTLQIILDIAIIPEYGILGAAWVALFIYILDFLLFVFYYHRFIKR